MPIELIEESSGNTYKILKHRKKIVKTYRTNNTGKYDNNYYQIINKNTENNLKNLYGDNGDLTNICLSFILKFPNSSYTDYTSIESEFKGYILSVFKQYDSTLCVSVIELDARINELYVYVLLGWSNDTVDSETKATDLLNYIKVSTNLSSLFTDLPMPSPFDVVELSNRIDPIVLTGNAIHSISQIDTIYNSINNETDITVRTVGLYNHIGIKFNNEPDNSYIRLTNLNERTYIASNINPDEDIVIVTLFDKEYKELYKHIQSPLSLIQEINGDNGDFYNETVSGNITLNLDYNDFITNNQEDFISIMDSQTGGSTVIIDVYSGSTIVLFNVIFDVLTNATVIANLIAKLNDDNEISNILSNSTTLNAITATKTSGFTSNKEVKLTKKTLINGIKYDGENSKLKIKVVGGYHRIAYKIPSDTEYILTKEKNIDIPTGFVDQLDVKIFGKGNVEILANKTYLVDVVPPVLTLIGADIESIFINDTYTEQSVSISDNVDATPTLITSGSVNTTTLGDYTITYRGEDDDGNYSEITRTVKVIDDTNYYDIDVSTTSYKYSTINGITATIPSYNNYDVTFGKCIYSFNGITTNIINNTSPFTIAFNMKKINGAHSITFAFNVDYKNSFTSLTNAINAGSNGVYKILFEPGNGSYTHCFNGALIKTESGITQQLSHFDNANYWLIKYNGSVATITAYNETSFTELFSFSTTTDIKFDSNKSIFGIYPATCDVTLYGSMLFSNDETYNINTFIAYNDVTSPVITLNGDVIMDLAVNTPFVDPGFTATDNVDGDITGNVTIIGYDNVNTTVGGVYIITYTVSDSNSNETSVTRTVNVIDPTYRLTLGPYSGFDNNVSNTVNLLDNTVGQGFTGMNLDPTNYFQTSDYKFTFACTYKFTSYRNGWGPAIFCVYKNSSNILNVDSAMLSGNGGLRLQVNNNWNNLNITNVIDTTYFLLVTIDKSANQTTITRVDDVVNQTGLFKQTFNVSPNVTTYNSFYRIGNNVIMDYYFTGEIDNVVVSNVILTLNEAFPIFAPATITLTGDSSIVIILDDPYSEPGYSASDYYDGDITGSVIVGGDTVDNNTSGTYVVTYTVTNSRSMVTVVNRTITVFDPAIQRFDGSDSFVNTTRMNLFVKDDYMAFSEPLLDLSTFFQGSWHFTFACRFNFTSYINAYLRLFTWGEVGNNTHAIYVALTSPGHVHSGSIIYGNQKIDQNVYPGTPSPAANTDHWLLFNYSNDNSVYLRVCLDRAGTNQLYDISTPFNYSVHGARNCFYIGGNQSNTNQGFQGSIREIVVSSQLLTWAEAFP